MPSCVGGFSFSLCTVASASVPSGSVDAAAACCSAIVLRVPHTTLVGIKLSSLVVRVSVVWGCYPIALFVVELSLVVATVVLRYHEKLQPVVNAHFLHVEPGKAQVVLRLKALITMLRCRPVDS